MHADSAAACLNTRPAGKRSSSVRTPAGLPGGTVIQTAWIGKRFIRTSAPTAVSLSPHTEIRSGNIAVIIATSPTASERSVMPVTDDYRARLERYLASMLQAKRMLSMGIITPEDYAIIDTMQREKFGISSCSLYRGIDLIYSGFRGNMSHYEEVTKCQEQ